jgi:hypothetical protein
MGVKFKLKFNNAQGYDCVVNFNFPDYDDEPITLYGGERPFVLQEFNSDSDYFKPVRPQQATIEILASQGGVKLEDFITDNDDDITVSFDFGTWVNYWQGYISQDDLQETWIAQNHILTLRADEGIGRLKNVPLSDNGAQLVGTFTPFALIQYAAQKAVSNFLFCRVISNLFHTSMTGTGTNTGLDQCKVDARTFERAINEYDDSYTVLEKINRAWSQTLFQYLGEWWIVRVEENFIPLASNLTGFINNKPTIGSRSGISTRYTAEVGVNQKIVPIAPAMLKTILKPSKTTTINYNWEKFAQVVCNESFQAGTKLREFSILGVEFDAFSVDDWTWEKGATPNTPTTITDNLERWRRYASTNQNLPDDDFVALVPQPSTDSWMKSCEVYVQDNDYIEIGFQHRNDANITAAADVVAFVFLFGNDSKTYGYNSASRAWSEITSWALIPACTVARSASGVEWEEFSSEALGGTPVAGYIHVYLVHDYSNLGALYRYVKDLTFNVKPSIQNLRRSIIKGDYDRYTISNDYAKKYDETIYLDDAETNIYKGAIYQSDGFTLTGDNWYRRRYNTERYTFKRHHAIAKWEVNRTYKTKLEANFFGLVWERSGTGYPIGFVNTINFVDDAPKKTFGITNLKEIDFMSCVWSAELIEIYDEDTSEEVPGDLDTHSFDFYYQ